MPYKLECASTLNSPMATDADIHRAFDDDHVRGEFIILTAPNGDYLQAANDGDSPFALEHRTKATDEHICAVSKLTKVQARTAFLAFLQGSDAWRTAHEWQPLPQTQARSGCLSIIVVAVVLCCGAAAWLFELMNSSSLVNA